MIITQIIQMVFSSRWIFKCLGCKSSEKDETEYVDLRKIKNVDEVIHIKDLVVSNPNLYIDSPKSLFITRKSTSKEKNKFGTVKPTFSIQIKNKWPSDISSEDSKLLEAQSSENNELNKIVVPLSNISGFLDQGYGKQELTISQSIAIAEKIYQNERKIMMKSARSEEKNAEITNYQESEELKDDKPGKVEENVVKITRESRVGSGESLKSTISMWVDSENEYQKEDGNLICYLSEYDDDEETITDKVWKMFLSATRGFGNKEYSKYHEFGDEVVTYERTKGGYLSKSGFGEERKNDFESKVNVCSFTPQDETEIVEDTIKRMNKIF